MTFHQLGRTGLTISAISLGTVELGLSYGLPGNDQRPTPAAAERLIRHALDAGINHLDTARAYGDAEAIIGQSLGGRRKDVLLTTKALANDDLQVVTESVETSLKLLRTDYVDVLMLHSASQDTLDNDVLLDHLLRLKDRGLCRFLGASVYGNVLPPAQLDCLQIAYSPLDRRAEAGMFGYGIGLVARSVLLKGALTHRYSHAPAALQDAILPLEQFGMPLPELAYRYALSEPAIATALVGTSHIPELDEILTYATRGPLPDDIISGIQEMQMPQERWLNPGLW